jgi:hypothetical protein
MITPTIDETLEKQKEEVTAGANPEIKVRSGTGLEI